ncbi:MAG: LysR family transcriptional regulator [Rhodospirillaceae bacterium]|nr:LysR family transcriptional regulator [Rhodospirillaceae bacterium]
MDLDRLAQFAAVARRGSIGAAAAELGLTQPALTRGLQRLEKELGGRLFDRSPRGVVVTAFGEIFLPYAQAILSEAGRADDALKAFKGLAATRVRVGISPNFVGYIVPAAVRGLFTQFPKVTVGVVTETYENLVRMLRAYDIDFIFAQYFDNPANLDVAPGADMRREVLFTSFSRAYVAADHALARRRKLPLGELCTHDWAIPLQMSLVYRFEYVFRTRELTAPVQKINSSSMSFIRSALYDFGLAVVLPDHIMAEDVRAGRAVALPVPELVFDYRVGLSWRARGTRTPAMTAVARHLRAAARAAGAG